MIALSFHCYFEKTPVGPPVTIFFCVSIQLQLRASGRKKETNKQNWLRLSDFFFIMSLHGVQSTERKTYDLNHCIVWSAKLAIVCMCSLFPPLKPFTHLLALLFLWRLVVIHSWGSFSTNMLNCNPEFCFLVCNQPLSQITVYTNYKVVSISSVSHDVDTHTQSNEKKKKAQVAQVLKFVSALKSRHGACEAGEGEINWAV